MDKNRRKGFTLVEVIVVIAAIIVIAGLFAFNMINTLKKNKEDEMNSIVAQIKSAADAYVSTNPEEVERLYNGYGYVDIPIGELRDNGYLKEDLKNAETGEKISDDEVVRVKLDIGDYFGFTFPLTPEEKDNRAWALVAEDLTIEYDSAEDANSWCSNDQNKFSGLYDSNYVNKNNYAEVTSKLYLMDNSKEGKMFDGNYFEEASLESVSCNVNPSKAGTYNVTYKYVDPSLKTEKTIVRTVYVKTSTNDTISFTATINRGKKIPLGARDVPIEIVETYKDGTTAVLNSTENSLGAIGYNIDNFTTDTKGSRVATITTIKVNSDGSKPQPQQPGYVVTDLLVEIVADSENCTPNNASTCYLRCEQTENYVSYHGAVYRIFGMTGNTVKFIYESSEIKAPYGQLGDCTNNGCCNGGRYFYNRLGQNATVKQPKMDTTLDNFYTEKNVAGTRLQSQSTPFGSKKVALLMQNDYREISKSCPHNYLVGEEAFWLVDAAEASGGPGAYNKGVNAAYAYDYAVNTEGEIYKDGAHKDVTFVGDYGTKNVVTAELAVRPTIYLNNPIVLRGSGTEANPYVIE